MRLALERLLAFLGGHETGVLLAFAGIVAGIWIFGAIAGEVSEGDTQAFDRKILLSMRHPGDLSPRGSRSFQESARDVTALGGVFVLGLVTLMVGCFLLLDGKARLALFLWASVASGMAFAILLKDVFHRPRPDLVPRGAYVYTSSFPSGHSMMSALTYLTLGALLARGLERKRLKAYVLILAAVITFLVGVSRVYLGVHWPTDVLAGWAAGTVWALLCSLFARWLQSRQALEQETDHSP